jgi:CDGSH iron-sulfur domain-containing protein 3
MTDGISKAEASPYQVDLRKGQTYEWCSCGLSKTKPFCDGSHEGTQCEPVSFVARKTETVLLCGCSETGDAPYCDGSHNML